VKPWFICAIASLVHPLSALADAALIRCEDTRRVSYSEHFVTRAEFVSLKPAAQTKPIADAEAAAWTWSPGRTSAYKFQKLPDFSVNGPWTSAIDISGPSAHPISLLLTFPDHGNVAPELTWLNENWLFAHLWLGRMVDASLLIDIDQGKIIHQEQGSHHLMSEACE
jgi:hypothetical protein